MRASWAVVLLSSLLLGGVARAAPPKVAVVVTASVNLDVNEGDELVSKLGRAIEEAFDASAISSADTRRLAPSVAPTCASDPSCSSELGRRLGVDFIIFVAAVKLGGQIQLDPVWASMAGGVFAMRRQVALSADLTSEELVTAVQGIVPVGELARRSSEEEPTKTTKRHMTTPAWVATGSAIGLAIVSVGFASWAVLRSDDCEASGCSSSEYDDLKADVHLGGILADVSAGAALLAGGTALILYYTSDEGAQSEDVQVGFSSPHGGFAIGLSGRF